MTVACPPDGWLAREAAAAGAAVVTWEATREPGPSVPGEVRRLRRVVARTRPDVLHLHSAKAGLAGRLAVRGRTPTVFQPHAWSFLAATGATGRAALAWERFATRWTDRLVCVSADERSLGEQAGIRAPATVVPNGVDLAALTPSSRTEARHELGLDDRPLAVCVGRLAPQKGQHDLLDLWPDVRAAVPGATLVLVGDGPDRPTLEARGVAGVRLVGSRDDVPCWYAAADLVVAPSRWEGMALAPLEAMACGRSVVATDVPGMTDGTVRVAGRRALTEAIAVRLAAPEVAAAEGAAGRAHVEAHHDQVRSAAAVAAVCSALAPAGR